ncbi:MAG: tRNA (adenosine(37)-N6)-threonylcarbamoyltransferase complex dimerization subunit type 1 TsaB [Paracoccaceae bacterium]
MILCFDTSGPWVALAFDEHCVVEPMRRGQAEALAPMAEALLTQAGAGWADLTGLAVGTGPGNFTGIRVSVAFARGLALGRGIGAAGIDAFDALGRSALPAPRGGAYLRGPGGDRLDPAPSAEPAPIDPATLVRALLRLAPARLARPDLPRPAPLYVRPPDAAPARPGPVILP